MNWQKIIRDILAAGHTQQSLAEAVGSTQTTISSLANIPGREPTGLLAVELYEMHKRLVRVRKRRDVKIRGVAQ